MNVYITSRPLLKLWTYIEALDTEVGGWGYAKLDGDDLIWHEVFLVPQHVTTGEVDFDATGGDAVAIDRAVADGVIDQEGFVWVSWHSHHSMKPFWSGTDDKRIKNLRQAGIGCVLSFVGCHDHSYKCRLDLFNVEHRGITVPHVTMDELKIGADPQDEVIDDILKEIQANVSAPPKKVGTSFTTKAKAPGDKLERALTVKALIEAGFTKKDAEDYADDPDVGDWIVGPEGVASLSGDNFDQMAWGDHDTDMAVS